MINTNSSHRNNLPSTRTLKKIIRSFASSSPPSIFLLTDPPACMQNTLNGFFAEARVIHNHIRANLDQPDIGKDITLFVKKISQWFITANQDEQILAHWRKFFNETGIDDIIHLSIAIGDDKFALKLIRFAQCSIGNAKISHPTLLKESERKLVYSLIKNIAQLISKKSLAILGNVDHPDAVKASLRKIENIIILNQPEKLNPIITRILHDCRLDFEDLENLLKDYVNLLKYKHQTFLNSKCYQSKKPLFFKPAGFISLFNKKLNSADQMSIRLKNEDIISSPVLNIKK